jgi:hypothetical protein
MFIMDGFSARSYRCYHSSYLDMTLGEVEDFAGRTQDQEGWWGGDGADLGGDI